VIHAQRTTVVKSPLHSKSPIGFFDEGKISAIHSKIKERRTHATRNASNGGPDIADSFVEYLYVRISSAPSRAV
jgi:hypothetical protein